MRDDCGSGDQTCGRPILGEDAANVLIATPNETLVFFFFKQKTAYEVVSRDWSSDVCSSDLIMQ